MILASNPLGYCNFSRSQKPLISANRNDNWSHTNLLELQGKKSPLRQNQISWCWKQNTWAMLLVCVCCSSSVKLKADLKNIEYLHRTELKVRFLFKLLNMCKDIKLHIFPMYGFKNMPMLPTLSSSSLALMIPFSFASFLFLQLHIFNNHMINPLLNKEFSK